MRLWIASSPLTRLIAMTDFWEFSHGLSDRKKDVDGPDKPGHDGLVGEAGVALDPRVKPGGDIVGGVWAADKPGHDVFGRWGGCGPGPPVKPGGDMYFCSSLEADHAHAGMTLLDGAAAEAPHAAIIRSTALAFRASLPSLLVKVAST